MSLSSSCRFLESNRGFLLWSAGAVAVFSGNQGKYWPGMCKGLLAHALFAENRWSLNTGFALFAGSRCKGFYILLTGLTGST